MIEVRSMNDESGATVARGEVAETAAWDAVLRRDPRYDDHFVFAVTSTGIYCRPSCPARRPRRENVRFFGDPGGAEAAGFRPCRRCHPGSGTTPVEQQVERAVQYLEEHLDETVTLEALGREVGLSPSHLQRCFKRSVGISPKEYVRARRLGSLKERLRAARNVLDATFEAGYGASSRAYDPRNAPLGMTPGAYRRGGDGMRIRYATTNSSAGRLLVAATEKGISAVMLADSEEELETALRCEYPRAELERSPAAVADWVAEIVRYLEGARPTLDLPLDVQATVFQWRVWTALRDIPYGETRSYGEIASAIGAPGAARAVARACGSNPVALTVPCHRVVPKGGGTGGYRWGSARKQRLLQGERRRGGRT